MTLNTAIVWFREDLRLNNNPALNHALQNHEKVVLAYLYTPNDADEWRYGAASRWWLHHSLASLSQNCTHLGNQLIIRSGKTVLELLEELIQETNAAAVYWNRLYTPHTTQRDSRIKESLRKSNIHAESFNGRLLFEPHEILKDNGDPYQVFTAFWKRCRAHGLIREPLPAPHNLTAPAATNSEPIETLGLLPDIEWDSDFYNTWQPGETGAQRNLDRFIKHNLPDYEHQRDVPSVAGTSQLSPHLVFGEISPACIIRPLLEIHAKTSSAKLRSSIDRMLAEIGWREFAHYVLYHFPDTSNYSMDKRFDSFPWQQNAVALKRWQQGMTGFPIIDAGMRQLWHTGWMHNRVRMLVASFLTKNLMIRWHEGARWFWDTLVDADLANNSLGWQWVAGCGTDAAPYFRIFNPIIQSKKFDPDGDYIRRWVPELTPLNSKQIHEPHSVCRDRFPALDYPQPIVDLKGTRERALATFKTMRNT